jgi:dienelactone hydrolase
MRVTRFSTFLTTVFLAAFLSSSTNGQQQTQAPLWAELSPGQYRVGFRAIYGFDRTRTWQTTRAYDKEFSADTHGRPIRISVWYPAVVQPSTTRMRYEDYIRLSAPKEFANLSAILERHDRAIAALSVPSDQMTALLATTVNAYREAPAASGHFPLILYFGGLNDTSTINVSVMAEYLASHGYVVATVPLLGPTNEQTAQARTQSDIETTVRDMEFAWSLLRAQPNVDDSKLAIVGHSLGGIDALVFAMRNQNVSTVIGLDATYGFEGATKVLTNFYGYKPENMRADFLDLRKAEGEQDTVLDLSAVEAFRYANRDLITVRKMHHSDFTSFAIVAQKFHLGNTPGYVDKSGWTRETGYRGYQIVCTMVRDFLDEKLKGDPDGSKRLVADVSRADGGLLKHESGLPAPPSPKEFVALIQQRGFAAATAIVDQYRREIAVETIVNESVFNSLGYELMAEKRFTEAIGILRLVTFVYPQSANAADSLGDAYALANQKANARDAYQKAIELVSTDSRFDAQAKKSFTKDEELKIEQLKLR